jgi:predicted esterase
LEESLKAAGADLDARMLDVGHELSDEDMEVLKVWMVG